jgi:hypothetical protein
VLWQAHEDAACCEDADGDDSETCDPYACDILIYAGTGSSLMTTEPPSPQSRERNALATVSANGSIDVVAMLPVRALARLPLRHLPDSISRTRQDAALLTVENARPRQERAGTRCAKIDFDLSQGSSSGPTRAGVLMFFASAARCAQFVRVCTAVRAAPSSSGATDAEGADAQHTEAPATPGQPAAGEGDNMQVG